MNPANDGRRRGGITKLVGLISAPMERAGPHAKLLQGRLPNTNGDTLEVALLPEAASSLNVQVGSTFTSVAPSGTTSQVSSGSFYSLQGIPPIQIVIPGSLGFAVVALVVICVITLTMMVRVVSRLSISQTLRLNED